MRKTLSPLFAGLSIVWIIILVPLFLSLRIPSIDLSSGWTRANSFQIPICGAVPRPAWVENSEETAVESAIMHYKGFPFAYQKYSQIGKCPKSPKQNDVASYIDIGIAVTVGIFLGYLISRRITSKAYPQ